MVDLRDTSGLPLRLEDFHLVFEEGLPAVTPDIRFLKDYAGLLAPGSGLSGPNEAYYMYRGVGWPEHKALFAGYNYRYDITVIKPGTIGREFIKTVGHYHPLVTGETVTYPEVYEVIAGHAHYLCQQVVDHEVRDIMVVQAKAGERVVIPPNYGHITINPGPDVLVMTNVTADGFSSIYEPFASMHGAALYELSNGAWIKNGSYDIETVGHWASPLEVPDFGLIKDRPLYRSITEDPGKFNYLVDPQRYLPTFKQANQLEGFILTS